MGCDIKLHIEFKVKDRKKWLHWNHPKIKRSYKLFTKMANVRPSDEEIIKPISEPKGLPKNLTETTLFHYQYDKVDAHSESWFDSKEIAKLRQWYGRKFPFEPEGFGGQFGYLLDNSLDMHEFPEDFNNTGIEDVRFVFWFMG